MEATKSISSFYDFDDEALRRYFDCANIQLRKDNENYSNIMKEIELIFSKHSALVQTIENKKFTKFTEEDAMDLVKLLGLYEESKFLELKEIFKLGANDNYQYLKSIGVIK